MLVFASAAGKESERRRVRGMSERKRARAEDVDVESGRMIRTGGDGEVCTNRDV